MRSEETRRKHSLAVSGERNHFYGRHHTEETKRKISLAKTGVTPKRKGPVAPRGAGTGGFNARASCRFCHDDITSANLPRHESACPLNPANLRLCRHCQKPIRRKRKYEQVFCCRACHQAHTVASNPARLRRCAVCNAEYRVAPDKRGYFRKTCSRTCLTALISQNSSSNPNCGARAHFKGSQRFQYGGILMDSAWEVSLAEWFDREGLLWQRSRRTYFRWRDDAGKTRRYTPDFYLPDLDCYVDTKNSYLMKVDAVKLRRVRAEHGIKLIAGGLPYIKAAVRKLKAARAPCP